MSPTSDLTTTRRFAPVEMTVPTDRHRPNAVIASSEMRNYYNFDRDHQALGYQTPDAFYRSMRREAA